MNSFIYYFFFFFNKTNVFQYLITFAHSHRGNWSLLKCRVVYSAILIDLRENEVVWRFISTKWVVGGAWLVYVNVNTLVETGSIVWVFYFKGGSDRHHFLKVYVYIVDLVGCDIEIIDVYHSVDWVVASQRRMVLISISLFLFRILKIPYEQNK